MKTIPNTLIARVATSLIAGVALVFGSTGQAGRADTGQQLGKSYMYSPVTGSGESLLMTRLLAAPAESGSPLAAEAQATVAVRSLGQLPLVKTSGVPGGGGNAVKERAGLNALSPADNPPPDPTVVILPTALGLQSPTDIPDFSMGASDEFIVNANSQTIYFQDSASNILASSTLAGFFSNVGANNPFEPKVTFDPLVSRWFIAAPDNFGTPQSSILLGVSQSSDPTMNWSLYKLATDPQGQTSAGALSSIGGNINFLVLSAAQFQNAGGVNPQSSPFQLSLVLEFDKKGLITNNTLSGNRFTDSAYLPCPAKVYDTQFPFVDILTDLNGNSNGQGVIRHGLIGTNAGQVRYIPSGESLSFHSTWAIFPPRINFLPQKGSEIGIDGGDGRIANVVMRNNMLYACHSVYQPASSPDHEGIHWVIENLATGGTEDGFFDGSSASLFSSRAVTRGRQDYEGPQEGAPSLFGPSITVSRTGDVFIAHNWCSWTSFPSSGFRVRNDGEQDFRPYIQVTTGTEPSVALKDGRNVGPNTSLSEYTLNKPYPFDAPGFSRLIELSFLMQGSSGSSTRTADFSYVNPLYLQGIFAANNATATGARGVVAGSPFGIFGNYYRFLGNLTSAVTRVRVWVPDSLQPGANVRVVSGVGTGDTPNSASLNTQPATVGTQRNQWQEFTLDRRLVLRPGESLFVGFAGQSGLAVVGTNTSAPLDEDADSTANGPGNFNRDTDVNTMVSPTTDPPCASGPGLDTTFKQFDANGTGDGISIAHGRSDCKPLATPLDNWLIVDDVGWRPDTKEFFVFIRVGANTSAYSREGHIIVGGQVLVVFQAGNIQLPAISIGRTSGPAGSPFKVSVGFRLSSNASEVTASAGGFTQTTTVAWNGEAIHTTFVSPTEIDAEVSADLLAMPGTAHVSVFDLATGGGTSPSVTFTITAPGPDFALGADQTTVNAQASTKAKVTVNVTRTGGFAGNVTVTPPDPQGGIKAKPADPIVLGPSDTSAVFKLKIGAGVAAGSYHLTFKGVDDSGRERDVTVTLVVM